MKRRKRFRKRHRETEGTKLQKQRKGNYSGRSPNWLVGFAGIVQKRMWPTRRSRTDKLWENNKKREYKEKCNRLERHLKLHHDLLEQLNNLVQDESSKEFEQELTEMCTTNAKVLCYILKGDPLCNLPSNLQGLLQDAINKDSFLKKELKREDVPHVNHRTVLNPSPGGRSRRRILTFDPIKKTETCLEQLPNACDVEKEDKEATKKKRVPRKRGYHVFVRKFQESETVVVDNLKPSDKGERLVTALEDKIGQQHSGCEFMCGSKKLLKNQALEEQGIERKSTIIVRRLHDVGPNSEASGVQRKNPESSNKPVKGKFNDVTRKKASFDKVNKEQGMDIAFDGTPGINQTGSSLEQLSNRPCEDKSNGPVRKKLLPSKQVYQLFVRTFQEPGTVVVDNLRSSDKGESLVTALEDKIGQLPSGCEFICESKKLLKNQTLKEQGIRSESNITLTLKLLGGMDPKSQTTGSDAAPVDVPSKWKKAQVAKWVDEVCDEYEIDQEEVKELKLLNGAGLTCLPKEDWIRRSRQGDFMFMKWNELVQRLSGLKKQTTPSNSEMDTSHAKSEADVTELKGSVGTATDVKDESTMARVEIAQNKSEEGKEIGPFGERATFDDFKEILSIDQIASQKPGMGDVITVTGLCSSRPNNKGGAGSVLLRNDPPTGSPQFLQLKVDIRANPSSNALTKYILKNVLDLQFGDDLVIRGRVETLDQGFKSKREGYTILPFKVVVDSDYHAAVRKNVEKIKPQLCTPWPKANLPFPAELDSHPLWQGDKLLKDKDVVWLPPETSQQEIKEFALAARNSRTTDILVGVKPDGSLIGKKILMAEVGKRREELCTAINSILPSWDHAIRFCENASDATLMVANGKSSFVAFMWLKDRKEDDSEMFEDESITILIHVHVTKGDKPVYFAHQDHIHAYVRVGTKTEKLRDFDDLFSRLESLAWRNMSEIDIQQEIEKASVSQKSTEKYELFKNLRLESDQREFKAIYGDPKDIILKDYVDRYTAAFLSTEGGDIYFGVEEDNLTKFGHVLGVLLSSEERKDLLRESAKIVCNFWPSVHSSQFFIRFVDLECQGGLTKHVLKYPKTSQKGQGQHILLFTGEQKAAEVQNLAKQIASKLKTGSGKLSLLRVKTSRYCLISEQPKMINTEQLLADLEKDRNFTSKVKLEEIEETELSKILRDLCVVHLNVKKSPYPIHFCHPPRSLCFDSSGDVQQMQSSELLARFKTSESKFDIEKFLRSVDNFDRGCNSFILMASPFRFLNEQDIYGLVIPEWLLVLDFDQHPHENGHLFDVFQKQHDLHQGERNLFLKTPLDRKLDINPDNGTSWCAVRGYQELAHTLSEESHGEWNISHGQKVKTHLSDELIVLVNPNQLVVVCLFDEDHENLVPSMHLLLEHVFSIWSRTSIIFVCPSRSTETLMMKKLIGPLHKSYGNRIKMDNVFVVSPQHLARHLAVKLPAPYCPENAFQLPKKVRLFDGDRTIPETLPQNIRQAVHGHLQIMYLKSGKEAPLEDIGKAREDFYSGSEISSVGLAHGIGIHREKIKDLKRELKVMLNDKKSHVCMIVLKAERGSGASTLCLQFLYENHERFPCAKLMEFHESLVRNIEKINQHTKLPLLLFVDSEMASLQDFTDFKNEAERRNIHVVLIVVESDIFYSTRNTAGKPGRGRKKGSKLTATPYSAGSSPYQIIELSRELEKSEIPHLVGQLLQIKSIPEDKEKQLQDLQKKAETESSLRKFAYFSLTIFGKKYTGLADYVSYRLSKTSEIEAEILEFLALTHVFTDHRFPVNALAGMLQTKVVILESVFTNSDVTELLSPPIQGKGERRISFGEVAEEILKQRAAKKGKEFEIFLSDLALRIAGKVLAPREPSKILDRITRRLFVTSEYESKKFSSLVRTLKDCSKDVARDTMKGLVTIFQEGTSMWAHLLAHLAKFHMIEYGAFDEASTCIERALKEQPDDVLLHHIRGDIIRLHIQNLKEKEDLDVKEVLKHAIVSSSCFQKVREKRPLVEYGYTSDALVRRIVMQAVVKTLGTEALFTDYLTKFLEEMRSTNNRDPLHEEEKFILALIPDAFDFLRDVAASEHTDQLKKSLLKEMGHLDAVKGFCEELKSQMKESSDSGWIDEVVSRTTNLVNILEMETGNLTTEQIDEWMASLEIQTKVRHDEHWMKLWIRYVRASSKVPPLASVQKEIEAWMGTTKGLSLYANFYNYVVAVLTAVKDPTDKEKMEKACKAIEEMKRKRYVRKPGTASPVHSLPLEWLNPKEGRHINSIDSLLHHDDLVKEYLNCNSNTTTQTRVGREIIERALFERDIKLFQGEVGEIEADWKGKIYLKRYIPVHFIPSNVVPSVPSTGDTVKFALSFGLNGPQAWAVICQPGMVKARKAENIRPVKELDTEDQSSGLESCDEEEVEIHMEKPLYRRNISKNSALRSQSDWEVHVGQQLQGIVSFTSTKGYGKIQNPTITGKLFFHASQIVPPVSSLKDLPDNTVVSFTVDRTDSRGVRATNVKVIKNLDDCLPDIRKYLTDVQDEEDNFVAPANDDRGGKYQAKVLKSPIQSGRQEGKVVCLLPNPENASHGFIEVTETGRENVFFHQRESEITASDMKRISVGTKVQFSIARNRSGDRYIAKNLYIQSERPRTSCSCGWEDRVRRGIQEGYISILNEKGYGFISEDSQGRGLYFHQSDLKGAISWVQLCRGMCVHFKVDENEKGCIAREVSVMARQGIRTPSVPVMNLPHSFPMPGPFDNQR